MRVRTGIDCPPHPSPPPHAGEGILLALNAFVAKPPPSFVTSPDFWVKLRNFGGGINNDLSERKRHLFC